MEFKKAAASVAFIGATLLSSAAFSIGQIDIRANQVITNALQDVRYRVSVQDCTQLAAVSVNSQSLELANALRAPDESLRCEFDVLLSGSERFAPSVSATDIQGQSYTHSETFSVDQNRPTLEFDAVSITGTSQDQWLELHLSVSDDVDVSKVKAQLLGIRASVLAEAGGVVDVAARSAFANSDGYTTVVPYADDQTQFVVRVPVTEALSAAEIRRDGVVLMDVQAIDASGNIASFNRIAFTGDDVQENILGVRVEPSEIVLTNALERRRLTTIVDFEFRGEVRLNTQTSGLSYQSQDPAKVLVTDEGAIYPLQETDTPVNVLVQYADAAAVSVPVTVDYSKLLTALVPLQTTTHLPSLNQYHDLTGWQVTFDDGSSVVLGDDHAIEYTVPAWATDIVEVKDGQILAKQVITADNNLTIQAELLSQGLTGTVQITSEDAQPTAKIALPSTVNVGETLSIVVDAQDDVGISGVVFFVNGQSVGRVIQPPYQLELPIAESLAGKQLEIYTQVTDTAAHVVTTAPQSVWAQYKATPPKPTFEWKLPVSAQVAVGGTDVVALIEKNLGPIMSAATTDIERVEYFLDGDRKATVRFPAYDVRKIDNEDYLFELWRADLSIAETSLTETSIAVNAKVYTVVTVLKRMPVGAY